MNGTDYYKKMENKWINEYPSSTKIEEVWDFYLECGYQDPQATIRVLLNQVKWNNNRILDLGCDNGFMLKVICDWYPQLQGFGLDINSQAIEGAQKRFPDLNFQAFDGIEIPFEDKYFDLVFVCAVVKHIRYEDRQKFYAEIRRVSDYVLFIEADSNKKEEVRHQSWTFYHSNFKQEFSENFKPLKVFHEAGDLLGLYSYPH